MATIIKRAPQDKNSIPAAFLNYRQFIHVKLIRRDDGKIDKIPCDINGRNINAHDPAHWRTIDEILTSPWHVGFVFTRNDPFWFIDLDNAVTGGMFSPLAAEVLSRFSGAAYEISTSGTGLHVFGSGGDVGAHNSVVTTSGGKIEFYDWGRFVVIPPGPVYGDAGQDHTGALISFIDAYGLRGDPAPQIEASGPVPGSTGWQYSDDELIAVLERMRGAAQTFGDGVTAWQLWTGDAAALARKWPEPGRADGAGFDRSSADAALFSHLCFLTGKDYVRAQRLFERSALYRAEKYEGRGFYRLERLMSYADRTIRSVYNVQRPGAAPSGAYDGDPYAGARANAAASWGAPAPQRVIDPAETVIRTEFEIPARDFLYGKHYLRRETSLTAAPGGTGKTALAIAEILAMVTGRRLLREISVPRNVIYFGEDHREEIERRFIAAMKHYQVHPSWLQGRLAIYSMRDVPLTFLRNDRNGTVVNEIDINAIKTLIKSRYADVVFFDTVRKIHSAQENDNGDMDRLIFELNRIAEECNCAIELLAHTKKPSIHGDNDSIDNLRGARSQIDSVRNARLIIKMRNEEGDKFGIDKKDIWQYVRFGDAKTNVAPPPNKSQWMRLVNITLANGDNVQTVVNFDPKRRIENYSEAKINEIREAIGSGIFRKDSRAKHWVGIPIAETLNIDVEDKREKRKINEIIADLVEFKIIEIYEERDDDRKLREFVRVINENEPNILRQS